MTAPLPTSRPLQTVDLYTDGACSPNPGKGGWGVVLIACDGAHHGARKELSGGELATTNNRMELLAAIEGLRALKRPCRVRLHTDSKYVQKAFTDGWLIRWKVNGWRTRTGEPVANADLWRELDRLNALHEVEWNWVRGHAGHPENTRADALAVRARLHLPG